jgi:hypothetical protein
LESVAAQLFFTILYFSSWVFSCSRFVDLVHEKLMNSKIFCRASDTLLFCPESVCFASFSSCWLLWT